MAKSRAEVKAIPRLTVLQRGSYSQQLGRVAAREFRTRNSSSSSSSGAVVALTVQAVTVQAVTVQIATVQQSHDDTDQGRALDAYSAGRSP